MPKYIEYESLKNKINAVQAEIYGDSYYETGYHNGLTMALTVAMMSPAENVVEVRYARWHTLAEYKIKKVVECTNCHTEFTFNKNGTLIVDAFRFCPECRAEMIKGNTPEEIAEEHHAD